MKRLLVVVMIFLSSVSAFSSDDNSLDYSVLLKTCLASDSLDYWGEFIGSLVEPYIIDARLGRKVDVNLHDRVNKLSQDYKRIVEDAKNKYKSELSTDPMGHVWNESTGLETINMDSTVKGTELLADGKLFDKGVPSAQAVELEERTTRELNKFKTSINIKEAKTPDLVGNGEETDDFFFVIAPQIAKKFCPLAIMSLKKVNSNQIGEHYLKGSSGRTQRSQ